ncbi:wiskott-Aldrich syndrome protein family member 1-like [Perognathus longimembris pacificus]|uniref:wiskott-Aldrich syndrome protein family member 1-like n=1 Tax=Perognathus longimembris pacificus TaxID=214514 RepID=UPI0020196524|nr:wiskott-Aldrich syndrome protein family member 1-like [Perognathus longimembris pacificus]
MSLKKEMDEEQWDQTGMTREIEVIHRCLNDIARQVTDLNKYVETLFGKVYEEIHRVSSKFTVLQENVTQLTDVITAKHANEGLTMQVGELGNTFPSTTIRAQQICALNSIFLNTYESYSDDVKISSVTTGNSYHLDELKGLISPDTSFQLCSSCPKLWEERNIAKNKGHKMEMFLENKKDLHHYNDSKHLPQFQPRGDNVPAACDKMFHSYVNQSSENSAFATLESSKISTLLTKVVGKALSSALHPECCATGDRENSCVYVSYGIGKREVEPQPPNHHVKAEVLMNPKAPASSPPPRFNWLAGLRASKGSEIPATIQPPTKASLLIWKHTTAAIATAATPSAAAESCCLQSTPYTDTPITPPKAEFCPIVPESFMYSELKPNDQNPQGKRMTSHLYPSSVIDGTHYALCEQPQTSSVFQPVSSSVSQSPLLAKSAISSFPSKLKSSHPPLPQNLILSTAQSSIAPQQRSLTSQRSTSVPVSSVSSCSRSSISAFPLPKEVPSPFSGHLNEQLESTRVEKPTRNLNPQQLPSPDFKLTEYSILQPLFSFTQPTPAISRNTKSHSTFQYSLRKFPSGLNEPPPSVFPILSTTRSDLMEAVRKGTVLHKPEDQCLPEARVNPFEHEMNVILTRRKAMGYSSEISDSESDWMEEK